MVRGASFALDNKISHDMIAHRERLAHSMRDLRLAAEGKERGQTGCGFQVVRGGRFLALILTHVQSPKPSKRARGHKPGTSTNTRRERRVTRVARELACRVKSEEFLGVRQPWACEKFSFRSCLESWGSVLSRAFSLETEPTHPVRGGVQSFSLRKFKIQENRDKKQKR